MSRCKFGRNARGYAIIKIEGVLEADPDTVYNFLKISTRQGGKVILKGLGRSKYRSNGA